MPNTLFIGKVSLHFKVLPSTNAYLKQWLSEASKDGTKSRPAEGTAVRADSQSAGKGQFGSTWVSDPGVNLMLSVVLYPVWLAPARQFYLGMAVALAVRDTMAPLLAPYAAQVKWPNDLYAEGKKTGGILIESTMAGAAWQAAIVGIGLNINQPSFPDTLPHAGSVYAITRREYPPDAVAERLFEALERRYLQLRSGHGADIRQEYLGHLLGFGAPRAYADPDGNVFEGTITDIDEQGRLCVSVAGSIRVFDQKEILWLPDQPQG